MGGLIDCLFYIHGFSKDEDEDWGPDGTTYFVEGREYRKTGANYGLAFDSQRGGKYISKEGILEY